MKTFGDKFIIKYDKGSIRNHDLGSGIIIEIAAELNLDVRGNSDQVGIIHCAPEGHNFFKNGDKVLTHYLSSSDSNSLDINGEKLYKVTEKEIFAKIDSDDNLLPAMDVYFCDPIIVSSKTDSGIYLTTDPDRKEPLRLRVTHVPGEVDKVWADEKLRIGDVIMSQDDYQYMFNYNKKTYVKIEHKFIAGVFENEESRSA